MTLVAIQSAQATPDQLWPALLPQFALDEVPEVTGTLSTDRFDWTLYRFDVALGELELAVELAVAEDDGATHLVLLQSAPDEFASCASRSSCRPWRPSRSWPRSPRRTPPPSATRSRR